MAPASSAPPQSAAGRAQSPAHRAAHHGNIRDVGACLPAPAACRPQCMHACSRQARQRTLGSCRHSCTRSTTGSARSASRCSTRGLSTQLGGTSSARRVTALGSTCHAGQPVEPASPSLLRRQSSLPRLGLCQVDDGRGGHRVQQVAGPLALPDLGGCQAMQGPEHASPPARTALHRVPAGAGPSSDAPWPVCLGAQIALVQGSAGQPAAAWSARGSGAVPVQPMAGVAAVQPDAPLDAAAAAPPASAEPAGAAAAAQPVPVSQATVRERLLALLKSSDLHTTTGAGPATALPPAWQPAQALPERAPVQSAPCASSWRESWGS